MIRAALLQIQIAILRLQVRAQDFRRVRAWQRRQRLAMAVGQRSVRKLGGAMDEWNRTGASQELAATIERLCAQGRAAVAEMEQEARGEFAVLDAALALAAMP